MGNHRIYYATQQIGMKGHLDAGAYTALHGIQSVAVNTTFNLEQLFELSQLSIYQNVEGIPDVQLTINKILDGYPPVATWATVDATTPDLAGRSTCRSSLMMSIFPDTSQYATSTPDNMVECSGLYLSSATYTFGVDGPFTEDVTLVGNDMIWAKDTNIANTIALARQAALSFDGVFDGTDAPISSGGVDYKKHILFDFSSSYGVDANGSVKDPDATILPQDIVGISASGTNEEADGMYNASIQSITVSTDLGRTNLDELGRLAPYHRTVDYPIEVTCEIVAISKSGFNVSAIEDGILNASSSPCSTANNTSDRTIRIATCEGLRLYLGKKNRLQSVAYGGGDAAGGNANDTYSYSTFNDFTIMHSGDANALCTGWWAARTGYLAGT